MEQVNSLEGVAEIVLRLALILIAAKAGGELIERVFKQPAVLGELAAGIVISPLALGGWQIGPVGPLFEATEGAPAIQPELFFVAQIAAIILLFEAGLHTNRALFFRYARPATAVAFGGVLLPFVGGMLATVWFGYASFSSAEALLPALFIGAVLTATSVGITARVLGDMKRLDTPEGVTILGAAVVDDVIGVIVLAVVVGIGEQGSVSAGPLSLIVVKAVGFWLGLTVLGSLLATRISWLVLLFRGAGASLTMAIGLALLAAAVAETSAGLAMIIGSYSLGLALSNTLLKLRIDEPMKHVNYFIVPLFFAVIGMQVDFSTFGGGDGGSAIKVVLFAVVICLWAVISKLVGAGLPALAVGFTRTGAARIGVGMLPRGEVALIVAGIGLGSGVIGEREFGVAVMMTVVTTVLAPVLLNKAFKGNGA